MAYEVFSDGWSRSCCDRLNARGRFHRIAADWRDPVVLVMRADAALGIEQDRFVFLELRDGRCQEARVATAEDLDRAGYVLAAAAAQWRQILAGTLDPISAIMFGKLRLEKGSLTRLIPHAATARELVAAASEVETRFPADPA